LIEAVNLIVLKGGLIIIIMKTIFKKAVSVLASVAMVGATMGMAAAVSYPAPFNAGNSAVVYGANSDPLDMTSAAAIHEDILAVLVSDGSGSTTVEGGYKLEKTANNFNLGDNMDSIAGKIDKLDLPNLLADGIYKDDNRAEYDYSQDINLSSGAVLTYFSDSSYKSKAPTLGFHYDNSNDEVLTYTITYKDGGLNVSAIEGTDLPLLGREYYVLDVDTTNNQLTLLDSSNSATASEGDSTTLKVGDKSYEVVVGSISADSDLKFTVNGESTDKLGAGESYKLDDGAYIAVKTVTVPRADTSLGSAEFTIASGKLLLDGSGQDVEVNEEGVNGLTTTFNVTGGADLDSIVVNWAIDEETFLVEGTEMTMPAFGAVKVVMGDINFPTAGEETTMDNSDAFEIETSVLEGSVNLPLFWYNDSSNTFPITLGTEDDNLIVNATADAVLNVTEGDMFVASYRSSDYKDYASYVYEVTSIKDVSGEIQVELNNLASDGSDLSLSNDSSDGDEIAGSDIVVVTSDGSDNEWATLQVSAISGSGSSVSTAKVYTAAGLTINLPEAGQFVNGTGVEYGNTTLLLTLVESNKEDSVESGIPFTVNVSVDTDDSVIHVLTTNITTVEETTTKDVYSAYLLSELATSYVLDKSGDSNDFTLKYYGGEVTADVYVTPADATVTSSESGVAILDDSASVSGKNVVVVGGSAINAIAANLLGSAYRGPAFTEATGVGAGEFLIETFAYGGKVALLVAGYEAADTKKAADYLVNMGGNVDVVEGNKYTGSSATEATLAVN
jgi:hypothetical protein